MPRSCHGNEATPLSPWTASGDTGAFGMARKGPAHLAAVERLKDWTRERFSLGGDDTVVVTETASGLPGCPPLETVVGFWTGGARHHFKVFKPVEAVAADDLPPAWMKPALALAEGIECACC